MLPVPPLCPAVIATILVPRAACPIMHLTDVSDSHSVPSHPVCPSLPMLVYATSPRPAPCTVTDAEPVPALFRRWSTLRSEESDVHAWLTLPCLSPAVITTRRVPRPPCPAMHLTDVSDSHSVPSHPVCPGRPSAVSASSPRPAPCTVTDADPVPARLYPRLTLTAPTSTE